MDFKYRYTPEQEAFRAEVRTWLEANIPEAMRDPVDRLDISEEFYWFWREMNKKIAEWRYPTYPTEYGGGGLSGEHETIILEEFALARVPRAFTNQYVFPMLLVWGTEDQKQKFLTPLIKGETIAFQNFTEPNAGSDLASLQSKAVRDGDDWVISGQKTFVSGMGDPDWLFGPIITDPDAPRHQNLGFFMVPYPTPGLELQRLNLLTGHDQIFVFMDGVRVPGDHLIGGVNDGWKVTQTTLELEHGGRGAAYQRDEALENLLDYTWNTKQNGHTLGDDPVLQQLAMDAYIDSQVNRLFQGRNYSMYQSRQEMSYEGSQSDYQKKTFALRNADRARDILGMYSVLGVREPRAPFQGAPEVYQRSSLTGAHPGGTLEVQRLIMARRLGISRTRERAAATPASSGVSGV